VRPPSLPHPSGPAGPLSELTAAVLAGGLGTRLRSVVADRPKPMAPVAGRPFLTFILDQLAAHGIGRTVLCTGHLGERVRESFGGSYRGMRLEYSCEPAPCGTGGALRLALPRLLSPTVLILNGDSYCDAPLEAFWAWHRRSGAPASLLLSWTEDTRRYGRVELEAGGRIGGFQEKCQTGGPGWISAGIYLLARTWIEEIPAGRPVSLERELFPGWVPRGLHGYRGGSDLLDIGTPEAYAGAAAALRRLLSPAADPLPATPTLERGPVS